MSPPQQAPDASSARKALVAWMRASGFWWDEARLDLEGGGRGDARGVCAVAAIAAPAMPPTQLAAVAAKGARAALRGVACTCIACGTHWTRSRVPLSLTLAVRYRQPRRPTSHHQSRPRWR